MRTGEDGVQERGGRAGMPWWGLVVRAGVWGLRVWGWVRAAEAEVGCGGSTGLRR